MTAKKKRYARKPKGKTLSELKMWIEGVGEFQEGDWVPTPDQWKKIREEVMNARNDEAAIPQVGGSLPAAPVQIGGFQVEEFPMSAQPQAGPVQRIMLDDGPVDPDSVQATVNGNPGVVAGTRPAPQLSGVTPSIPKKPPSGISDKHKGIVKDGDAALTAGAFE